MRAELCSSKRAFRSRPFPGCSNHCNPSIDYCTGAIKGMKKVQYDELSEEAIAAARRRRRREVEK